MQIKIFQDKYHSLVMEEIKETLKDPIKFKIHSANYYLSLIPNFVPMDDFPEERVLAERVMESFLYFALSSVDILYLEINQKLSLGISVKNLNAKSLNDGLSKSNLDESNKILNVLEDCSRQPHHTEKPITEQYAKEQFGKLYTLDYIAKYENRNGKRFYHEWNREKSWLWELRLLRNQITHRSLLSRMAIRGDENGDFLCVRLDYSAKLSYEMFFVANPNDYFSKNLKRIEELITTIRTILS